MQASNTQGQLPWRMGDFDAALIDLDGTMVDTLDDFAEAMQRMLAELPAPYREHRALREEAGLLVGKGSENLVNRLLEGIETRCGLPPNAPLRSQALERYLAHYAVVNGNQARVYDGVTDALDTFRAHGWRLGCVTNKPGAFANDLLRQLGLMDYFTVVLGGDATPRKKPDPMPLLLACDMLGVVPQRTLMVGDSSNDARAAKAAGCPVLLVRYGYNHGEDINDAGADALVDSLASLHW